MIEHSMRDPGLLDVMQNWAVKSPSPFARVPNLDAKKEQLEQEGKDGLTLIFAEEVSSKLKQIAKDLDFASVPDFIVTATSVFGQMLGAAKHDGYTMVILVNPETQQVIEIPLVKPDDMQPDRSGD